MIPFVINLLAKLPTPQYVDHSLDGCRTMVLFISSFDEWVPGPITLELLVRQVADGLASGTGVELLAKSGNHS